MGSTQLALSYHQSILDVIIAGDEEAAVANPVIHLEEAIQVVSEYAREHDDRNVRAYRAVKMLPTTTSGTW